MTDRTIIEWPPEDLERLRALWLAVPVLATAEIGRQMGRTKNSVVGKAHRIGLPSRESPIRPRPPRPTAPSRATRKMAAAMATAATRPEAPTARPVAPVEASSLAPALAELFLDPKPALYGRSCQWLFGAGRDATSCTAPALRRRPYCFAHCATAYVGFDPSLEQPADRAFVHQPGVRDTLNFGRK